MEREKATNDPDLPHHYIADRAHPDSECRCGRAKDDALHHVAPVRESAAVPFVTEKGS